MWIASTTVIVYRVNFSSLIVKLKLDINGIHNPRESGSALPSCWCFEKAYLLLASAWIFITITHRMKEFHKKPRVNLGSRHMKWMLTTINIVLCVETQFWIWILEKSHNGNHYYSVLLYRHVSAHHVYANKRHCLAISAGLDYLVLMPYGSAGKSIEIEHNSMNAKVSTNSITAFTLLDSLVWTSIWLKSHWQVW